MKKDLLSYFLGEGLESIKLIRYISNQITYVV